MSLTGDFAKLKALGQGFLQLAKQEGKRRLLDATADATVLLARIGIEHSQDVSGHAFKSLRYSSRKPLNTAKFKDAIKSSVLSDSFKIESTAPYAAVHQTGMVIRAKAGGLLRFKTPHGWRSLRQVTIPKRQFMPEGLLPASWFAVWEAAAEKVLNAVLGG